MRQSLFRRRRIRSRARGACSFDIEGASGRDFMTYNNKVGLKNFARSGFSRMRLMPGVTSS